ncbi:Maf family protein [Rhodoferax sp.]|uniref:Maf family protein n=1 Tax=Rhodoferax sp. TaxID=50421 RepID=UPI0027304042|nr:Maf family protein [Rhodoferax sp.]MDP1529108.1 Maf family protein [Rhodoferax sp.]MDP1945500.1 Maf family protein [Rhodoferax sp.]MDP2440743.1 Maf family protein [Rhodoferax sp.]MDZ4209329.1 Maf family protein [Rhodoferax sp.]
MGTIQRRIYLCSQDPRRRELLKQIGINFEVLLLRCDPRRSSDVNETPLHDESAEVYVRRLCQEKVRAGSESLRLRNLPLFPVLAAETVIVFNGQILRKPVNANQAADMLRQLSGHEHQVLSAVAVVLGNRTEVALSVSSVRFARLSEDRISRYLRSGEYAGKAGAYAMQGLAGAFVEHLAGSYSGVMGLPLSETVDLLQRFDYPTP